MAKNCYIIDGYNVLRCADIYADKSGSSPNFKDWTDDSFNRAREALLNDVSFLTDDDTEAVIVYDSSRPTQKFSASKHVRVIFSGNPDSADETIERIVHNNAQSCERITVVSNDHIIQSISLKNNALRMSVSEFVSIIGASQIEKSEIPELQHIDKGGRISERIDKTTAEKLMQLSCDLENEEEPDEID